MSAKFTYSIQSDYLDKWVTLFTDTRDFCLGYLKATQNHAPRNGYRILRSDGKVIVEHPAEAEVSLGMIAGWPTPEQYEGAAARAMSQAHRIRAINARRNERFNPPQLATHDD